MRGLPISIILGSIADAALAATAAVTGLMTGLLGVGRGFIIVPLMRKLTNVSMHGVVATSLMVITLVGGVVIATMCHGVPLPHDVVLRSSVVTAAGMRRVRVASQGGILIGGAAGVLVLSNGRIAGISGILGGLLSFRPRETAWRAAFLAGLIGATFIASMLGRPAHPVIDASWAEILAGGFLVGIGTRYAGGCTSGHGVCGLSRGSVRSLIATATFMAAGFLTVFVLRHVIGG